MRRNNITHFDHGQEQAQRSAEEKLKIIMSNLEHLEKVRKGKEYCEKARQFNDFVQKGIKLSPNQLSFVDGLYEKMMKGAGYESCNLHIDKKRRGIGI